MSPKIKISELKNGDVVLLKCDVSSVASPGRRAGRVRTFDPGQLDDKTWTGEAPVGEFVTSTRGPLVTDRYSVQNDPGGHVRAVFLYAPKGLPSLSVVRFPDGEEHMVKHSQVAAVERMVPAWIDVEAT